MASLVLGAVGTAIGGATGIPLFAQLGGMIGSMLGGFIDGALFGSGGANVKVGRARNDIDSLDNFLPTSAQQRRRNSISG